MTEHSTLNHPNLALPSSNSSPSGLQIQFLRNLWDGVNYGIFTLDVMNGGTDFRFSAFNPAIARSSPIPTDLLLGKTITEAFPSELASLYHQRYTQCLQTRQSISFEEHFQHNGQETWWQATVNPLFNENDQVYQLLVTAIDISDRKANDARLREKAKQERLLNQLANQIRSSLNIETIIQTSLKGLHHLLELDHCAFSWYDASSESPSWRIIHEVASPGRASVLGTYSPEVVGPIEKSLLNQEIISIDNVEDYEEPIHKSFLQAANIQSELLLPIQTTSGKVGVLLCVTDQHVRPWLNHEIKLLKSVGNQIAIAIDQAELYAQSREQSQALEAALEELQRTHAQMLQSEKMSSLGQLVAGIAHEINNPVNFIHGNISHASEYAHDLLDLIELYQQEFPQPTPAIAQKIEEIELEFLIDDLPKLLNSMKVGTERIHEIVRSLRIFSRLDEAEVKPVDLHDGIDSTLMILQNRIKAKADRPEIQILKDYGKLPLVDCYSGQLNQVFMNILVNAIDALEESYFKTNALPKTMNPNSSPATHELSQDNQNEQPTIKIRTELLDSQGVAIHMMDNGSGISEQVQQRLFDPFFTTKPIGKGTGMGMSISYQIVTERHGGKLICQSQPGQGTEFIIKIPIRQQTT